MLRLSLALKGGVLWHSSFRILLQPCKFAGKFGQAAGLGGASNPLHQAQVEMQVVDGVQTRPQHFAATVQVA